MALFINRWSTPFHVFDLPAGEAVDLSGAGERYEASGRANKPSICGMDVDAANSQGEMWRDKPHVLRVSRMERWDGLEDFVTSDDLCEDCRERLPDHWPPAAEYLEAEQETEGLGELFG